MAKLKILVIDDDYSFAAFAKLLIDSGGYEAIISLDSEEGIALAKTENPRAILLDAGMPGVSGCEAIQRLKADPCTRKIPIILCSITQQKSEISQALQLGALHFLPKPLNPGELKARLDEAVALDQ